jgi:hypothetical protein
MFLSLSKIKIGGIMELKQEGSIEKQDLENFEALHNEDRTIENLCSFIRIIIDNNLWNEIRAIDIEKAFKSLKAEERTSENLCNLGYMLPKPQRYYLVFCFVYLLKSERTIDNLLSLPVEQTFVGTGRCLRSYSFGSLPEEQRTLTNLLKLNIAFFSFTWLAVGFINLCKAERTWESYFELGNVPLKDEEREIRNYETIKRPEDLIEDDSHFEELYKKYRAIRVSKLFLLIFGIVSIAFINIALIMIRSFDMSFLGTVVKTALANLPKYMIAPITIVSFLLINTISAILKFYFPKVYRLHELRKKVENRKLRSRFQRAIEAQEKDLQVNEHATEAEIE